MTPGVHDFKGLVRWLADTYHGGAFYPMAARLGISAPLIYQWKDGVVKRPSNDKLAALCAAYDLDWDELMRLLTPARPPSLRRTLVSLLLVVAASSVVAPLEAGTVLVSERGMLLIGRRLRREQWSPSNWAPGALLLDTERLLRAA